MATRPFINHTAGTVTGVRTARQAVGLQFNEETQQVTIYVPFTSPSTTYHVVDAPLSELQASEIYRPTSCKLQDHNRPKGHKKASCSIVHSYFVTNTLNLDGIIEGKAETTPPSERPAKRLCTGDFRSEPMTMSSFTEPRLQKENGTVHSFRSTNQTNGVPVPINALPSLPLAPDPVGSDQIGHQWGSGNQFPMPETPCPLGPESLDAMGSIGSQWGPHLNDNGTLLSPILPAQPTRLMGFQFRSTRFLCR